MSERLDQAVTAYAEYVDANGVRPFLSAEGYAQSFDRTLRGHLGLDLDASLDTFSTKDQGILAACEKGLADYLIQAIESGLTRAEIAEGIQSALNAPVTDPASDPNSL